MPGAHVSGSWDNSIPMCLRTDDLALKMPLAFGERSPRGSLNSPNHLTSGGSFIDQQTGKEVDIHIEKERTNGHDPRDTPSLRRPFDETQPFTQPVFKTPPKLPTPPLLLDDELAARKALRRLGWPIRSSPVSRSSHGYLPESGVLSTNHRDAEGSASSPIELGDGEESSDESNNESNDESSHDRSEENDGSDTTGLESVSGAKQSGDKRGEIHPSSDSSTSVEQGAQQDSPNTSEVPGPKASSNAPAPPPPPPPPPPLPETVLSSISDIQTDDSDGDTGHETSPANIPTCATSPGTSSSNEGKINTVIGGEGAGGPVAAALILQEHQDISWLNIDHFLDSHLGFEDSAAEDKYQKMGNIEDKSESHGVKDGQAEDGSQEMDHIVNRAEDGHVGEGEIEHDEEGIITDPEMDGIEVDGCGSHSKGGHRAGVGGGAEGEQNESDAQVLPAPVHSLTPRIARRGCGRPRRSRTAITVGNAIWEVTKIARDKQLGEGQVLKVQAEAWLAEKDLPSLQDAIATYQGKQGRMRGKRKIICGGKRRSAHGKIQLLTGTLTGCPLRM
ncbi:MAG: hypothetical protein LQ347_000235 [Umbilicaria vellea]|nr:MAG: hypothetical protein LQ347_000235 [Umbilicaria vellea]